jgi:hypothetical protein
MRKRRGCLEVYWKIDVKSERCTGFTADYQLQLRGCRAEALPARQINSTLFPLTMAMPEDSPLEPSVPEGFNL